MFFTFYFSQDRHSCYLFDCGSPERFKCKFTDHDSYTSSILNITRQTYELNQWRDQSQHEYDLKSLLRSEEFKNLEKSITSDAASTKTSSNSFQNPPSKREFSHFLDNIDSIYTLSRNPFSSEHRCQHFQFPCKNSTECIAIYNVCDGITQCPDGSDEAKELKCPPSFVDDFPRPKIEPTYKPTSEKSRKGPADDVLTNPRMFEYPKAPELDLSPGRAFNGKFATGANEGFRYNPIPQSEYFNPGGSYLFPDTDYSRDLTPLFWPPVQAPPPPSANEMRDSLLRQEKINPEPLSQPLLRLSEFSKDKGHKDWSSLPQETPFDKTNSIQNSQFGLKTPIVSQPSSPVPTADPVTSAKSNNPISTSEHKPSSQFHSSALIISPEAIAVTHLRDSGSSGRDTNSAVIALTLGICITVMLVVLVGCRMKSIHRKIARRGGRSLAHDADYLVNGMYL